MEDPGKKSHLVFIPSHFYQSVYFGNVGNYDHLDFSYYKRQPMFGPVATEA